MACSESHKVCDAGHAGGAGAWGIAIEGDPPTASPGTEGMVDLFPLNDLINFPQPPLPWIAAYIHSAELDYVNNDTTSCINKLLWSAQLIRQEPIDLESPDVSADEYTPLRHKISSLTESLARNLDAFGQNGNYVPLISFDFILEVSTLTLELAGEIEEDLSVLIDQNTTQSTKIATAKTLLQRHKSLIARGEAEISTAFDEITTFQDEIRSLGKSLDVEWERLNSSAQTFKTAVERVLSQTLTLARCDWVPERTQPASAAKRSYAVPPAPLNWPLRTM